VDWGNPALQGAGRPASVGGVIRPVDVLLEFLAAEQARGVTHVHLDEGAREALREVFALAKNGGARPTPAAAVAEDAPVLAVSPSPTPAAERPVAARVEMPLEEPKAAAPVVSTSLSVSGSTRAEQIDSLRRQAENWGPAKSLGSLRDVMVFSTGNPEARVMLVGEAPGYQEEREREPFVGPAGQKLNDILKAMGIHREEVYISNIVKFRPATPKQTTNNRKPTPEEMAACMPFVRAEIGIVKPECIIALGGTAAEGLLGIEGSVTSMRGKWHEISGTPVRVTYHPSYLLQSGGSNNVKRQVWEDMLAVMEKIGLPISEKQRGYFLPKA
jgi:uracil-DNA glycosylase family 4